MGKRRRPCESVATRLAKQAGNHQPTRPGRRTTATPARRGKEPRPLADPDAPSPAACCVAAVASGPGGAAHTASNTSNTTTITITTDTTDTDTTDTTNTQAAAAARARKCDGRRRQRDARTAAKHAARISSLKALLATPCDRTRIDATRAGWYGSQLRHQSK